jgi:hypothetical protein
MAKKRSGKRGRRVPKTVLRLPDLDQAKSAVLNTLSTADREGTVTQSRNSVDSYCSESRQSFSKSVVLRYRIQTSRVIRIARYYGVFVPPWQ